jgi:hypothetical protein
MSNTWVKFRVNGAPYGYAYLENDVVEVADKVAERLFMAQCCQPATPKEIDAAKVKLAAEEQSGASGADKKFENDSIALLQQRIAVLEKAMAAGAGAGKSKKDPSLVL